MKFLKRLLLFLIMLLIGAGIYGYYNGMTVEDYKALISQITINQETKESEIEEEEPEDEIIAAEKKKITKPEGQKTELPSSGKPKKETKYELLPEPKNRFAQIDHFASNTPEEVHVDVITLAAFLQEKAKTDLEKARAIYVWIVENIRYDDEAYNTGVYPNYTAEYVLESRKAVCEGYSNLYLALGQEMGLEIKKVTGFAKGYGYRNKTKFYESNHAWNIIKLNGTWRVFDSTWGSGYGENVNGKLVTSKRMDSYWFNVDPYEAIFNHYPKDIGYCFVQPLISLSEYEQMPQLMGDFFSMGFNGKEVYAEVIAKPGLKYPKSYDLDTYVEKISAPRHSQLLVDQVYHFEFFIPRAYKVAAIDADNGWTYFERNNGRFSLDLILQKTGELSIGVQHEKGGTSYQTILKYHVLEQKVLN